jgi:hypothetical protein
MKKYDRELIGGGSGRSSAFLLIHIQNPHKPNANTIFSPVLNEVFGLSHEPGAIERLRLCEEDPRKAVIRFSA